MSWYAVDAIDDALDASRAFLFPFSLGRWARLALITLFVGGGGGGLGQVSNLQNVGQFPTGPDGPSVPADPVQPPPEIGGLALVAIAVVLLVILALLFISATFEFVFVDVIDRDRVRILSPFGRHVGNGLQLLVFNVAVTLVTFAPIAIAGYFLFFAGGSPGFDGFGALGSLGPAALVVGLILVVGWFVLSGLVSGLTRTLVVPVMVATGTGIVGGWRRLWPRLRDEWKQTLVYLVMHFFVGIGVGLVGLVLTLLGVVLVGIVALVVGLGATAVTHGGDIALGGGIGLLAGGAAFALLAFFLVFLPVGILTATYLRTYELAALAGFDASFDLLGAYRDRRRGPGGDRDAGAYRGDDGDDGTDTPSGSVGEFDEFDDDRDPDAGDRPGSGDRRTAGG